MYESADFKLLQRYCSHPNLTLLKYFLGDTKDERKMEELVRK